MDIRLVRGRTQRLWAWTGTIIAVMLVAWGSAFVFGDATNRPGRQVGAKANFGADRAQVVPMQTEPFETALPLEDRELGRMLRLTGTSESQMVRNAIWVRTNTPRRWILVRFEPAPEKGTLRPYYPGAAVNVEGYLQKISRAEFDAWIDSLGVGLPRPTPGVKFGDLPDSGFTRIDSLFIRNFYISVRPEGAGTGATGSPPPTAAPVVRAPRPAPRAPVPKADSAATPDSDLAVPPPIEMGTPSPAPASPPPAGGAVPPR
ncbi:MAG TPA: hypothetical protein VE913_23560 [Longimicrobium sp.]|nr:hypothetical protein [Longimicrobium sp.]